ncbi:MAG: hypothetical protein JO131_02540 [Gammaproteobacteria bacterium]|nr:hypothetical protein [Gammaproteobacteria bacterium]
MGTIRQYENDRFIYDLSRAVNDTGAIKINTYPPIAIINGRKDMSFTVFSESDWGSLIMRNYYNQFASCAQKDFFKTEESIKLVKKTPSMLVKEIEGSHFFFVGEVGAKKTVNEVINLIEINNNLLQKFMELCRK